MRKFPYYVSAAIFIYLLIAFLAPVAMHYGYTDLANGIYSVYRFFCHQRVERSLFLFGEHFADFYTISQLQKLEVIPALNPYVPIALSDTIFGHPYHGSELVGYKIALCIRDIALYSSLAIFSLIYLIYCDIKGKTIQFSFKLMALLTLPMLLDVAFQTYVEFFNPSFVSDLYVENNLKRIVTGALFGVGFGMFIFSSMRKNVELMYNEEDDKGIN